MQVNEIMTEDQLAEEVLDNMRKNKVRRLAVVGRNKQLVGAVSLGDLARQLPSDDVSAALGMKDWKQGQLPVAP